MAISFDNTSGGVELASVGAVAASTDVVVSKPLNIADGDFLLAFVSMCANSGSEATITLPSGFSDIQSVLTSSNYPIIGISYKECGASEPSSYTFTLSDLNSTIDGAQVALIRVTGADSVNFLDVTPPSTAIQTTTDPNSPSITTVTDGAFVLSLFSYNDGRFLAAEDSNGPSGYTVGYARSLIISSTGSVQGLAYKEVATAGAEDPGAWTGVMTGARPCRVATIAIRPATSSAPAITDAGDELFQPGESITITGTGFGATQGTVTIGGWSQTVTNWDAGGTSITITVVQGGNAFLTNLDMVVTDGSSNASSAYTVQLEPAPILMTWTM